MEECVGDFMLRDSTVTDVKLGLTLKKHWRSQDIHIFTYLDDGTGEDLEFYEAQRVKARCTA